MVSVTIVESGCSPSESSISIIVDHVWKRVKTTSHLGDVVPSR